MDIVSQLSNLERLHSSEEVECVCEDLWSNCEELLTSTFVPKVEDGCNRPCEEIDFEDFKPIAERNLQILKEILIKIQNFPKKKLTMKKSFVLSVMLLCGEHCYGGSWSTSKLENLSKEVLELLCTLCACKSVEQLLIEGILSDNIESGPMFKSALLKLRAKLLKDSWKCYPSAVACYKWLLFHVKSPHLSDHLGTVLPTALIILDDYVSENRVCGIECVHHIVDNVSRTSLSWYGQGDVIYKALESILYVRDKLLVQRLIKCMVTVLDKVEGGLDKEEKMLQWSRYDDSLMIILQTMELEQNCALRLTYIQCLPLFLESMGLGLARWSKRLLRVIQEYLEVAPYSDMAAAEHALLALQVYLKKCKVRISHHYSVLVSMLLRILYDVTSQKELNDTHQNVLLLIEKCLTTVINNAPDQSKHICTDIKTQARFNSHFTDVIDRVFGPSITGSDTLITSA